ncbi:MAG: beta-glucosidase [Candidatus Hodarchaeota archaeon]
MPTNDERKINWKELRDLEDGEIEKKVAEILSMMTLKEKAFQMCGKESLILGGLKMLRRYNSYPLPSGDDKKLGIEGVKFSDGPRGIVMGSSTCFPVSMARAATWDVDLEERIGEAIGIEGRAQGANYFGGVCINLLRHPSWGRAQETYGEDQFHVGKMGVALVNGVQKHIMACAKHYACNSIEKARFKVDVQVDERTLREVYLWHFRKCVEAGVASIMNAYNKVNGHYCGHNRHILRDILKEDWQFKGFVITDFLLGIRNGAKAVNAGVDIEMPFKLFMKPRRLIKQVYLGHVPEEHVDEAVTRILRQKLKFNKTRDPSLYTMDKVACDAHVALALEAARKGIVLLKNQDNVLPIKREKTKKILVLGKIARTANIGDLGSSRVYPPRVVSPLEGIKNAAGSEIEVVFDDGMNVAKAASLVEGMDAVVIIVGFTQKDEGEWTIIHGGDRYPLDLNKRDEKLISTISEKSKNVIVVLESGTAITMEAWKDKVPGILIAWYPGMEGGTAIGEILFGDVNPSGRLPFTIPKSIDHLPFFNKRAKSIEYGYFHGYKLLDKDNQEPAFPFGFGLSYTTFSRKNLKIDKKTIDEKGEIGVSVDVKNEGNVAGDQVVQAYVGYNNSAVTRPVKELKGFTRISLDPGESKTASIKIQAKDLGYYDVEKGKWMVEKIEYTFHVGFSSRVEDLLSTTFKVT